MLFYSSMSWFVKAGASKTVPRAGRAGRSGSAASATSTASCWSPRAPARSWSSTASTPGTWPRSSRSSRRPAAAISDWDGRPDIHRPDVLVSNGDAARRGADGILRGERAGLRSATDSSRHERHRLRTIEWVGGPDGFLRLLDQTLLADARSRTATAAPSRRSGRRSASLRVRGAPAIGVAAAYGRRRRRADVRRPVARGTPSAEVTDYLRTSRPTAVNLFWALDRMDGACQVDAARLTAAELRRLLDEAAGDRGGGPAMCRAIGRPGRS